jgi:glucose-6-phosphate-specific signal transduction histidine kinase
MCVLTSVYACVFIYIYTYICAYKISFFIEKQKHQYNLLWELGLWLSGRALA